MKTLNRSVFLNNSLTFFRASGAVLLTACLMTSYSYADDDRPSIPPDDDPSHFGELVIGDLAENLPDAHEGTFEGGLTGTGADAATENVLQQQEQRDDGIFNVPTNGAPSPLFNAIPFTQKMLRFEEFGTKR